MCMLCFMCMGGSDLLVFCRPWVINQAVTGSPWAAGGWRCPSHQNTITSLCTNVFLSRPVWLMAWWRISNCHTDVTGKSTENRCVYSEHVQTWCNQLPLDSPILKSNILNLKIKDQITWFLSNGNKQQGCYHFSPMNLSDLLTCDYMIFFQIIFYGEFCGRFPFVCQIWIINHTKKLKRTEI